MNMKDLRIDLFQLKPGPYLHRHNADSGYVGVRVTHLPTGTVVTCTDEASEDKNQANCFKLLEARFGKLK